MLYYTHTRLRVGLYPVSPRMAFGFVDPFHGLRYLATVTVAATMTKSSGHTYTTASWWLLSIWLLRSELVRGGPVCWLTVPLLSEQANPS